MLNLVTDKYFFWILLMPFRNPITTQNVFFAFVGLPLFYFQSL